MRVRSLRTQQRAKVDAKLTSSEVVAGSPSWCEGYMLRDSFGRDRWIVSGPSAQAKISQPPCQGADDSKVSTRCVLAVLSGVVGGVSLQTLTESLILAQDERWRRA